MESVLDLVCKTENFPDGQKIMEAWVRYSRPIRPDSVTTDTYCIQGRTVEKVTVAGDTVCIRLREKEPYATVLPTRSEEPEGDHSHLHRRPIELNVRQVLPIRDIHGKTFAAWENWQRSTRSIEPVIEEFRQWEYESLKYNLCSPRQSREEKYPLVVFLHDARPCSDDPKVTLSQGDGAVCWAEKQWQQRHPCFVLAPQVASVMANDNFEVTEDLEKIHDLINHVVRSYPVDPDRVYITGQSMGCMAACELLSRYPGLFAAGLLAAGQWSPERMKACRNSSLWVLVSEDDIKAFPGMNAVMNAIESTGAAVSRGVWDAKAPDLDRLIQAQAPESHIHYTVFQGSSVVPPEEPAHPGTNHEYTWRVVYRIDGLKEWLFRQTREPLSKPSDGKPKSLCFPSVI